MNAQGINQLWRLAAFPQGLVTSSDFRWCEELLPGLADGWVRVRTLYISLDPSARLWASGKETYLPALSLGDVMRGITLGVVEESADDRLKRGDLVSGMWGWQRYAVVRGQALSPLPRRPEIPLTAYLAVLGPIGLTAYFGLLEIGQPRPGETVLVSAAAGAVGSLVAQIARIAGCRVVGIAGGADKCRWLADELSLDATVDYKAESLPEALDAACPDGVDLYFDNVGGEILDAAMGRLNLRGRIVSCGLIGQYNDAAPRQVITQMENFLVQRARMQAFIVTDYLARAHEALQPLTKWLRDGRLRYRVETIQGLEKAPIALNRLFDGSNQGKLVLQVAPEPLEV